MAAKRVDEAGFLALLFRLVRVAIVQRIRCLIATIFQQFPNTNLQQLESCKEDIAVSYHQSHHLMI